MAKKKMPDFEEQMQRLNAIIQQLESMNLPLEQSVALYKEGRVLSASCKDLLENARNEVKLCTQEGMADFFELSNSDNNGSDMDDSE